MYQRFHNFIRDKVVDFRQKMLCQKLPPCLILNCDGGICSQIHQYLWGQILIDAGYPVKYDLTFYEDNAKDMYGNFDRSYALDKLCYLERNAVAPRYQVEYYKRHYLNPDNQPPKPIVMSLHKDWPMPLYLGQYYTCNSNEYLSAFKKYIHLRPAEEILDHASFAIYKEILATESVGVHVRRGDMSQSSSAWVVPSIDYFIRALTIPEFQDKEFYFFSDEIDWVKQNILPGLSSNIKYHLVDQNDSSKGYMDFYLLSRCKYQIASQGTFGSMAFVLNPYEGKILVLPKDSRLNMQERLAGEHLIFISLDGHRL